MGNKDKNPMRRIVIDKVTINIGVGQAGEPLEKAEKLIMKMFPNKKPVRTKGKKRIPEWGVRPGLEIGVKLTLRGKEAEEALRWLLKAVNNTISTKQFDKYGNFSFGIKEYVWIPGMKYDPEIGMYGMDVCVSVRRPGYRVMYRKIKRSKIPSRHRTTKEEVIEFLKEAYNVRIVEEP
ncbi:50S ribosomal protein L5 [Nanoarchaeota archaeon NZ13-N]|uniref:Large ribosomal subunit protein uL5 n=1 Tax=Candidatus Nanoclepta minutus TaxID=1940235 RepID=A0A397WNX9_9ARCH|nr:MAG: 50S ribosomal protein L5 [Nanoarchaeota archaeon NZ13-N]RIB35219.1 MAG: 50S ribosomal protein L5 [Candidatus Nanoclepta minutus]